MESSSSSSSCRGKEDGETKGGEMMMRKLRDGVMVVGKRGGPTTPSPTWRLELLPRGDSQGLLLHPTPCSLSARKLCAGLWEIQPRMSRRYGQGHGHPRGMGIDPGEPLDLTLQPPSNGDPSGHGVTALEREYYPIRDDAVHQSVPEEGCCSSIEAAHLRRSSFQPSSFDLKREITGSSSRPKTSTELLKVLNRIWSLEERNTSNKSILKALRSDLDHSQMRIKELMQEKRHDKQLMENLLKQVAGDKFVRSQKERDKVKAEARLLNEELEEERSLRSHAESLHWKLTKEFDEMKSTYASAQQELERERRARILLESLCDEFAKGIRDYEQVVRSLTNKPVKQSIGRECLDRLILHISEAWLDERLQMNLTEAKGDSSGKSSIVDKLNSDIETFLQATKQKDLGETSNISPSLMEERRLRRHSPESFALNEAGSAPHMAGDEDQSPGNSLEQSKRTQAMEGKTGDISNEPDNGHLPNPDGRVDSLDRSRSMNLKDNQIPASHSCQGDICVLSVHPGKGGAGKQRPAKATWPPSRKSSKGKSCMVDFPGGIREGTLMAKLLEARIEGQRSSSKAPQGSD